MILIADRDNDLNFVSVKSALFQKKLIYLKLKQRKTNQLSKVGSSPVSVQEEKSKTCLRILNAA